MIFVSKLRNFAAKVIVREVLRKMIPLPSKPKIVSEEKGRAIFELEGLYPGYGQTIGTSLRRVLLSSLEGAAITTVKIQGVGHEFSTIEGVKEDVVDILLNLKQMRFRLYEAGPFTLSLAVNGEKEVTGKDFEAPSQVEVITKDFLIATLTSKKSSLVMEATVESGVGYVPADERSKEKVEVGVIALDAAFSPVQHVNFEVENMRVGDRTDYNKIRFDIKTDQSIDPKNAFEQAAHILVEQFRTLTEGFTLKEKEIPETREMPLVATDKESGESKSANEDAAAKIKIDELRLSNRTLNVLFEAGIKTVAGLSRKKEESLREIEGLGDKGIQEIKKALGNLGITLKQ